MYPQNHDEISQRHPWIASKYVKSLASNSEKEQVKQHEVWLKAMEAKMKEMATEMAKVNMIVWVAQKNRLIQRN